MDDRQPDRTPEEEVLGSRGARRRRKLYIGERLAAAAGGGLSVTVRTGESEEKLRHHVRHSPTGFECGYGGSGPAELARCILIDFLDRHELAERESVVPGVEQHYQAFKVAFLVNLTCPPSWTITGEEIAKWLDSRRTK